MSSASARPPSPVPDSAAATDLLRVHRPGMGSAFEIRLGARLPGALELASRALDRVEELERQLTIYNDESEVSRLNASAHLGPVVVEEGLFRLLELARAISEWSGGAYDVTAGALSLAWGFVRGPRRVPTDRERAEAMARSGWRKLRLDPATRSVSFAVPGMVINLGSIGKGYAIDRAVDVIRGHLLPTSALVHGGRSSLYALGSPPGRFADRWEIALRNPYDEASPLGVFRVRNRAIGTSGGAFQNFEAGGRSYGHILDPRSGEPADGPASVTVLAPTAAEADALSTALYILGPDAARDLVARRADVGVVFVDQGPPDRGPRVVALGLGPGDFATS
ncbi:FAD:protein FMN transferase [Paludisphaera sp.]|uniref:FAD:protein FMN transferase n=1 Tax=Paludisphaera sp. TaxID=2017432 RepID=UPI00301BF80E